jgi:hypothetical protein
MRSFNIRLPLSLSSDGPSGTKHTPLYLARASAHRADAVGEPGVTPPFLAVDVTLEPTVISVGPRRRLLSYCRDQPPTGLTNSTDPFKTTLTDAYLPLRSRRRPSLTTLSWSRDPAADALLSCCRDQPPTGLTNSTDPSKKTLTGTYLPLPGRNLRLASASCPRMAAFRRAMVLFARAYGAARPLTAWSSMAPTARAAADGRYCSRCEALPDGQGARR